MSKSQETYNKVAGDLIHDEINTAFIEQYTSRQYFNKEISEVSDKELNEAIKNQKGAFADAIEIEKTLLEQHDQNTLFEMHKAFDKKPTKHNSQTDEEKSQEESYKQAWISAYKGLPNKTNQKSAERLYGHYIEAKEEFIKSYNINDNDFVNKITTKLKSTFATDQALINNQESNLKKYDPILPEEFNKNYNKKEEARLEKYKTDIEKLESKITNPDNILQILQKNGFSSNSSNVNDIDLTDIDTTIKQLQGGDYQVSQSEILVDNKLTGAIIPNNIEPKEREILANSQDPNNNTSSKSSKLNFWYKLKSLWNKYFTKANKPKAEDLNQEHVQGHTNVTKKKPQRIDENLKKKSQEIMSSINIKFEPESKTNRQTIVNYPNIQLNYYNNKQMVKVDEKQK
jgi:hypothetical protein